LKTTIENQHLPDSRFSAQESTNGCRVFGKSGGLFRKFGFQCFEILPNGLVHRLEL
jgi:ribosomal protein S14